MLGFEELISTILPKIRTPSIAPTTYAPNVDRHISRNLLTPPPYLIDHESRNNTKMSIL